MAEHDSRFEVAFGMASDVGHVRAHNEDNAYASPPVFLVADGMGGHARGDVAAAQIVEEFRASNSAQWFDSPSLHQVVERAAHQVAALQDGSAAPGSTLTGLGMTLVDGSPYCLVFNIGDSRTYLFEEDELEQLTVDHSRVQELVSAGQLTVEQARRHPQRNVITRALGAGMPDVPEVDQWLVPASSGQRFLCCSDGLHGEVEDAEIARVLRGAADPQSAAQRLVDSALEAGGRDNVTVIVVDVVSAAGAIGDEYTDADADAQTLPNAVLEAGS
ncbi:PP2C family serine/threonine-protein phosphatase [Yimella sp. cx-51]|uniref:PP2C family protein-serine/threonine phosphatase n=1 Tax=Yimella sp. cx-51 TaxID=2770551 RepID=UPI00165D6F19|nr:protein phosphatase 2C domain-containing protein [Yimella sp. cx-51]MBC9955940.1 serine/threonine-protein phosphatase [Yimella sp. cx-51]MBD2758108.1 serine/threonine-protein phosphatase [Yimella sp. cx-573]QTH37520.1 serine/threonine-protein phosphatase [Yimella sp. cx-51]